MYKPQQSRADTYNTQMRSTAPYLCVPGTHVGSIHSIGLAGQEFRRVQIPLQHSGKGPTSPAVPASQTRAEMQDGTEGHPMLALSARPCAEPDLYYKEVRTQG